MQYSIVGNDGETNITVFHGGKVFVAHSSHPHFNEIREGVLSDDPDVLRLFDLSTTAATKFDRLSERVTVANQRLYFDGVEVDNALANQVVRFINDDVEDWRPLVSFFDNVMQNPQEHSREQLYEWLTRHQFTITDDGMIVGYKGVAQVDDETFQSISSGTAIVNGEVQTGRISQKIGDIVEMPRDQVAFDPSEGCSTGLHVGNYRYANGFARGALLEVHVNPRDVVSVPTDSNWEKVRVCRYKVVGTLESEYTTPVRWSEDYVDEYGDYTYDDDDSDPYYETYVCDRCGNEMDENHSHGENNECLCDSCYCYDDDVQDQLRDLNETPDEPEDDQISNFEWGF